MLLFLTYSAAYYNNIFLCIGTTNTLNTFAIHVQPKRIVDAFAHCKKYAENHVPSVKGR